MLWLIYTHLYTDRLTADIFKYFDDGKVIYDSLFTNPMDYFKMLLGINDPSLLHYYQDMRHWSREFNQGLYNENRTLIRFNALIHIFSFGSYHVHTVFMCFLSTMGLMGIFKAFSVYLKDKSKELFAAVFLLPSVLFWGSGVLKEGLILFSLGMSIYYYFRIISEKFNIIHFILLLISLAFLSITKLYIVLIILPAMMAHLWISKSKNKYSELKYLVVLISYFTAGLLIPNYDFPFMLMEKQRQAVNMAQGGSYLANHQINRFVYIDPKTENRITPIADKPGYCKINSGVSYVSWDLQTFLDSTYIEHSSDTNTYWVFYDQAAAGSYIKIPMLNGSFLSIVNNAPAAFSNIFFRPFLYEAKKPFMILAALENSFLVFFALICIFFCYRNIPNRHLLYFCLTITIMLFVLVGVTTPILGAAVRYKIPALPFLAIGLLLILDKQKLLNKFPFLKKIIA